MPIERCGGPCKDQPPGRTTTSDNRDEANEMVNYCERLDDPGKPGREHWKNEQDKSVFPVRSTSEAKAMKQQGRRCCKD